MKRKKAKTARWTPGLKKLKAISIRQPWAWLIVNGYKDVENRIWEAKLRGWVLIHAGQSKSDTSPEALAYIKRKYRVANLPDKFETGGMVGIAEITDCVRRHRSKWFHGPFGWTLARARRLPFKSCKGQLKFFTPHI
jgi:ASCH domain